ncbi:MAG: FimB/Mfa2 family fimbrial subunit [Prevotella sp.]|nr:FimB/Mfa2 family fimbrial subunit [Prevotella sp.]
MMKQFFVLMMTAICCGMSLGSCSQEVVNESCLASHPQPAISITTRTDLSVNKGVIYLMDTLGTCVSMLESDGSGNYASASLNPGEYDLYALASDNLASLNLPSQEEASATSLIKTSGETMGDLLMAHQHVCLQEGRNTSLNLTLDRKVICLKEIQITQVPSDVAAVSLSIAPLYPSIFLNGSYGTEDTPQTHTIQLDKGEDDTWCKAPDAMLFPSMGTPNMTVTFTLPRGPKTYLFTSSESFTPNHPVRLLGTYSDEWETSEIPVAKGTYQGYYVVSVDQENRTAVLLRKTQEKGITSEAQMNRRAKEIDRPAGALTDHWRLPTEAECRAFLSDTNVNQIIFNVWYYCLSDGNLIRLSNKIQSDGTILIDGPYRTIYVDPIYYRPVIDVRW